LQGVSLALYTAHMARRIFMIALLLFLLASIPVLFYFWARSNGQPVPVPALNPVNKLLPTSLQLPQAVEVASLDETLLVEPFNGDSCFFNGTFTCLLGNDSTEPGQINIAYNNTLRPDINFTLGMMLADQGAIYQNYKESLIQRSEPQPVYNAIIQMVEHGNKQGVNPTMIWAYYDYLYTRADELQIPASEVGLDSSGTVFKPDPQTVATALATARKLFPEEGSESTGIVISEDDLSKKLNRTSLSQAGKAMIYVTAQLFGAEFTQQVFTVPQGFANFYDQSLRSPNRQGPYTLEFTPFSQEAAEFYSSDVATDFIVCHEALPYACTVTSGESDDSTVSRTATCDKVEFLKYFCSTKMLMSVE